jgi:hypothetical protein
MPEHAINTLLEMFAYYENYGLPGNPNVLNMLLKRPATTFSEFIHRHINLEQRSRANGNHEVKG